MTTYYSIQTGVPQWVKGTSCDKSCLDCPDFTIKRHDTRPSFRVAIEDCSGIASDTLQEDNLIAEVSMWAKAKLKSAIASDASSLALADNAGFDQILEGDIIFMDRVRKPERMLITGFDETNHLIQVQRGYQGTVASDWIKGTSMRIFRIKDAPAAIERVYQDVLLTDGTTDEDQLTGTYLVYEWQSNDTCVPGCFTLEFKLLQMLTIPSNISIISSIDMDGEDPEVIDLSWIYVDIPSNVSDISIIDCSMGSDVGWIRRYPQTSEGFTIQIFDSQTAENQI